MKRIVNGVTYNTDTSTRLGLSAWDDDGKITETLYQTRGGAFFLHRETVSEVWNEEDRSKHLATVHTFQPQSPADAHEWIMTGEVEIFRNPFDDPPEAAAEAEPGATIYIRVPASLKRAVDEAAKGDGLSGNVWSMRCVERCIQEDKDLKALLSTLAYALRLDTTRKREIARKNRVAIAKWLLDEIEVNWVERFGHSIEPDGSVIDEIVNHTSEDDRTGIDEHIYSITNGEV